MSVTVVANPLAGSATDTPLVGPSRVGPSPARLHRELGLDEPTPLHRLDDIAARIGVGHLLLKDESARGPLSAFKILGASWASFRVLCDHFALDLESAAVADVVAAAAASPITPTLVTATDGNHGRAVAHSARMFGVRARIIVPEGTSPGRVAAIEAEKAACETVVGDYDTAVARAASLADEHHIVVSDTSWEGYSTIPAWVTEGYGTIFAEIDRQVHQQGAVRPDVIVIPVGVGSLAAAAVHHYRSNPTRPTLVSVEPRGADCLAQSILHGRPTPAPGPHASIVAGCNCGNVSPIAWPALRDGIDWAVVVDDPPVVAAMRLLADRGVVSGETGAATLGAVIDWARHGVPPWTPDAAVVVLSTEGATDSGTYAAALDLPSPTEPA